MNEDMALPSTSADGSPVEAHGWGYGTEMIPATPEVFRLPRCGPGVFSLGWELAEEV